MMKKESNAWLWCVLFLFIVGLLLAISNGSLSRENFGYKTVSATEPTIIQKIPMNVPKGYRIEGVAEEYREADNGHKIEGKKITGTTDKNYLIIAYTSNVMVYPSN